MRRCYLVCYDIRDEKRLRRVFKVMKGYGEHWQFSVFFCALREIDRVRMQADLEAVMNLKEDQALILDLGSNEQAARDSVTSIGQGLVQLDERVIVV